MNSNQLLLPSSTRLVHIGPFKTGTTSLQGALDAYRKQLEIHGVHFACPESQTQPVWAVLAATNGRPLKGSRAPRQEDWTNLLDDVRGAGDKRVVVSSEFLSDADDAGIQRVVTDMPGGPVHVVVTLRPLAEIAPSQWQQHVQNGLRTPYAEWLARLFDHPDDRMTALFWRRHDHGALIRRWSQVVGSENLTVVVADKSNPNKVLRTFESLLGLPDGLLTPVGGAANRSLLPGEVELVRQVNQAFSERDSSEAWSAATYRRLVRNGLIRKMKTGRAPTAASPRLETPSWALRRLARAGADSARTVASLGVRVVGDLDRLVRAPEHGARDEETGPASTIPADAVALAVVGAMRGSRDARDSDKVAASLATLAMPGDDDGTLVPAVAVDAAARAVCAVIEARGRRRDLSGLPSVPADVAGVAMLAAVRAATPSVDSGGLPAPKPVLDALDIRAAVKPKSTTSANSVTGSSGRRVQKQRIDKTTSRELLAIVARRGRGRLVRVLPRQLVARLRA